MTHLPPMAAAILLGVTILGALLDIRRIEVPGWLSITGVILGVGLNLFLFGLHGLLIAAAGLSLAIFTYLALHLLRVASIDRLKLMAPVGAIVGPWNWLTICLFSVVLGIPIAIVVALSTAQLHQTGGTKGMVIRDFVRFIPPYNSTVEHLRGGHKGLVMRHGALIAIGALFFLATTTVWMLKCQ